MCTLQCLPYAERSERLRFVRVPEFSVESRDRALNCLNTDHQSPNPAQTHLINALPPQSMALRRKEPTPAPAQEAAMITRSSSRLRVNAPTPTPATGPTRSRSVRGMNAIVDNAQKPKLTNTRKTASKGSSNGKVSPVEQIEKPLKRTGKDKDKEVAVSKPVVARGQEKRPSKSIDREAIQVSFFTSEFEHFIQAHSMAGIPSDPATTHHRYHSNS